MSSEATPAGALSGIRVADFSRLLGRAVCSMMLADLGAEVIEVESPAGDDTRRWSPTPIRLSGTPPSCKSPPPRLDQNAEAEWSSKTRRRSPHP